MVYDMMFWHCETITTINLINISITYFCCDGENIIYSFSQFQVSNTLLLTIVTMMYITPPQNLLILHKWNFVHSAQHFGISPIP